MHYCVPRQDTSHRATVTDNQCSFSVGMPFPHLFFSDSCLLVYFSGFYMDMHNIRMFCVPELQMRSGRPSPSEAMMHFPVSDFLPISEKFSGPVENFPNFILSLKYLEALPCGLKKRLFHMDLGK